MGRQKAGKPRRARKPEPLLREWYGSAIYGEEFHHADVRTVGNSVQMTLLPAELEQGPGIWMLRLRAGGDDLERMADAFEFGREYIWGQEDGKEALIYLPAFASDEEGTLGRVPVPEPGGDLEFLRRKEFPLPIFEEMGRSIRKILPALDSSASHDNWTPEEHAFCDVCARPVFDTMPSGLTFTPSRGPLHLCPMCVRGETLKMLRTCGPDAFPEHQALLRELAQQLRSG